MIESVDIIDKWIYSTLSSDSALSALVGGRFSAELSSSTWSGPYVYWSSLSNRLIRSISGTILDSDSIYAIVARTQSNSFADSAAIASRVRTLLDGQNVTIPGASLTCFLESTDRLAEVVEGVTYRHVGGQYRIRAVSI